MSPFPVLASMKFNYPIDMHRVVMDLITGSEKAIEIHTFTSIVVGP